MKDKEKCGRREPSDSINMGYAKQNPKTQEKRGLQGVLFGDGSKLFFFRHVRRHRAAIEFFFKNKEDEKINKKKKTHPKPWTLKVALRPSGVLLVNVLRWHCRLCRACGWADLEETFNNVASFDKATAKLARVACSCLPTPSTGQQDPW